MNLQEAPVGIPLSITHISGGAFPARMERLGLYEGARLMRLDKVDSIGPAKVRTPKGDAILSAWLAGKIVIHLDDGRRIPLPECKNGDSGHVEGVTGQSAVEEALKELGIVENDRITFLRSIPPMIYKFSLYSPSLAQESARQKSQISEALASHLFGHTPEGPAQFSSVGVGTPFTVQRILPGGEAEATLAALHVTAGMELILESVAISHEVRLSQDAPVACVTKEGLRLYFHEQDAAKIFVAPV